MNTQEATSQAVLSNQGDMTSFRYADYNIRFRTPSILKKYVEVRSWDYGYIVVMADYDGIGITEEYIDLVRVIREFIKDNYKEMYIRWAKMSPNGFYKG